MNDRVMQILAFLTVAGFLAIVLWHVPRLDLAGVILLTLAALAYDFVTAPTSGRRRR